MSPERAIELVAARCETAGGMPDAVTLADRGDAATAAVAEWFRSQGVKVVMKAPADKPTAADRAAALLPDIEIAYDVAAANAAVRDGKTTVAGGAIGWAVLKRAPESGEDFA